MHDHHPAFPRTGATADLPAGTPAPEQDMGQTRALLLEMARCQSLDQIFRLVAETFAARQDVALCRIWLLEQTEPSLCASCRHFYDCRDHRQCLRLAASTGRSRVDGHAWTALDGEHSRFSLGLGKVGLIAQSGTAYHVDAVRPDMDWVTSPDWIRREGIRTFLGQPLVHRGRVLGVFAVFSREVQDAQAMDRLRMIADYLAVSIANAQAFEELTRLKRQLEIENAYLKNDALPPAALALTGDSPCMRTLKEKIRQVACTDVPVLITGEAGSGKEAVAAELHRQSFVAGGPLVRVNCAAIAPDSFEDEFFGHAARMGFLEAASGGTLFLDAVDELPLPLQARLLRVLQDKEFHRGGEDSGHRLSVRLVAATSRDLYELVRAGLFREDLYYRLNAFPIRIAPLRERPEDILPLAQAFLEHDRAHLQRPELAFADDAPGRLQAYAWPGNVRELQECLLRAAAGSTDGLLHLEALPPSPLPRPGPSCLPTTTPSSLPRRRCRPWSGPISPMPCNGATARSMARTGPRPCWASAPPRSAPASRSSASANRTPDPGRKARRAGEPGRSSPHGPARPAMPTPTPQDGGASSHGPDRAGASRPLPLPFSTIFR